MPQPDRRRVADVLEKLAQDSLPENFDARPLVGKAPLWRARVGALRIVYRQLGAVELRALGLREGGYRIARIVYRRDLDRAVRNL